MEMTIRARDRRGGRARTHIHALTHTGEKGRYRGGRTERTETLGVARYGEKGGVERELGWKERGERKRETKRNETKERKKERKGEVYEGLVRSSLAPFLRITCTSTSGALYYTITVTKKPTIERRG